MELKNRFKRLLPTAREKLVLASMKQVAFSSFEKVLVVGVGQDPYRNCFSKHIMYTRLDLDIDVLRKNGGVVADAIALPFKANSFDCVVATEVLEHLASPNKFMRDVYRVLSNQGVVVLTVPFMFHEHAHPDDYSRLTTSGLLNMMKDFSDVDIHKQGTRLHTISDLISTSFYPKKFFLILRIFNWLLPNNTRSKSTAPSGFFIMGKKGGNG